ncbi:hypothetical protein K2173_021398 [Erythroxylum novogranatense]|uniref:Uncharacterized protein n=1 Tax=Erythroxylum novogranatense TaxID=1862640 RepID=A0AAV8TUW9_9ROSI|nr:hypothetical protein K2173_021398 [Erythroxylum novogranatense]
MIGAAIRFFSTNPKPKMKQIELRTPPEQTQTITRTIFDVVKEHGPISVSDIWEKVQEVGLRGLKGKRHMKIVMRWMRERQKIKLICNHIGPHKQFMYTTWFSKSSVKPPSDASNLPPQRPKIP